MSILDAIGRTPLIPLTRLAPANGARVLIKAEWGNPTGSMKDRMALAAISRAESDGRLQPGWRIVEYTGGSTGASLALVASAKGYRITIVTSDAFSLEKRNQMKAYGAELIVLPSEEGKMTKELFRAMIARAAEIAKEPNTYWTDQLNNLDSVAGYYPLAEEVWTQTGGKVDGFVQMVGTGASSRGVATILRQHNPKVRTVAVEPAESPVLQGGAPGAHKIEGVGIGFIPPLWQPELFDEVVGVKTDDAKAMARRLAKEEGIFAGTSTGANVIAALGVAERLGAGKTVVAIAIDSGLKYLGTDVFA